MPPANRSGQSMVDSILGYVGIDSDVATAGERTTALAWINEAYRAMLRGTWYNQYGSLFLHQWSFLTATADLSLTTDTAAVDCPSDFGGIIDNPTFQYSAAASTAGIDIKRSSSQKVRRYQRDDNTSSTPEYWALNQKTFVATSGSQFELLFSPTPDADLTINLTYLIDPDDLTDSATNYPVGIMGCEQLIVQLAKLEQERTEGDVGGPESRKAKTLMREFVLLDTQRFATEDLQQSCFEQDSGIS